MLPVADPSQQWEVINAGGISYASYRVANVAEELIQYDPDLFIIYCGQNEFLEQRTYAEIRELPSAVVGLGSALSHTRVYSTVKRIVDAATRDEGPQATDRDLLPGEVKTLLDGAVGPEQYRRDDETRDDVLEHFRYNLTRMVQAIESVGANVVLVTPASNLRSCEPFKSQHRDGLSGSQLSAWNDAYARAVAAMASGDGATPDPAAALVAIEAALAIDDRYAHAHYLRGRALWDLERYEKGKAAFVRALDEDVCPLRALSPIRQIVAEAAEAEQVPLVDFVAITERLAEHATPGDDLFLDHVHPTIEGNRQVALAVLDTLAASGVVNGAADWNDEAAARVKSDVEASLDIEAHGRALLNLAKVLDWAGKYAEGAKAAEKAIQLVPNDAAARYEAGVSLYRLGRNNEARRHFMRALEIDPQHTDARNSVGMSLMDEGHLDEAIRQFRRVIEIDPNFTKSYINLGVALESRGDSDKANAAFRQALKIDPNMADAHNNLANVLQSKQQYTEAIEHYKKSLQLRPNAVEEHFNLARAYQATRRYDLAVGEYQQALLLQPDLAAAHSHLGTALRTLGRTEQAAAHLREAIRLQPADEEARANLKAIEAAPSQP
jgi:tetratricopeptide (TPR) repeat protein